MRKLIASLLAAALLAAPAAAHAKSDLGGCLVGPSIAGNDVLSHCTITGPPATALAAVAAPIIVAGAAYTIISELHKQAVEVYDVPYTQQSSAGGQQPQLALTPEVVDRYREGPNGQKPRPQHLKAFEFNDRATNIATAVAGAAVVGAIIATVATKH
jgi:hypothetical protein